MANLRAKGLMPHNLGPKRGARVPERLKKIAPYVTTVAVIGVGLFALPSMVAFDLRQQTKQAPEQVAFPVSVDPINKTITEAPNVDALIQDHTSTLSAAAGEAEFAFTWLASLISSLPLYQQLAASDTVFVTIRPGYRKEEVAATFAKQLHWTTKQRQQFLTQSKLTPPTLDEGQFMPGTYSLSAAATPAQVQALIYDRFTQDIISRYSTSTAQIVPVDQALTIASLLEREAGGVDDMRLISGIIWNRLFVGMNLQIDATLQYAKANNAATTSWWPKVVPNDKYIKSAYNTYKNKGLPPGPIANPSVASVIAALNPKQTDCLFYFHDRYGNFYCSATYEAHVALLKKHYGRGK